MKKLLLILILCTVFISCNQTSSCASEYKSIKWKLSHTRPVGTPLDDDARYFVNNVKDRTDGRISTIIFPANQLGDYTVVQERVALGDVELMFNVPSSTVDKRFALTTMPYLATSWEELEFLYGNGGAAREIIEGLFARQNIVLLAVWPALCSGIGLNVEPISPEDPNVPKNLKIRVMPLKASELTGEALGYMATPLAFGDVFTAIQTGMINGVIGTGPEGNWSNYRDLVKYYCDQKIFYEPFFLAINKDAYDELTDADRQVVNEVAAEMEAKRWTKAPEEHDMYIEKLKNNGTQIIVFTPEQLNAMREKIQKEVWPKVPKEFPPEIQEKIIVALKERNTQ